MKCFWQIDVDAGTVRYEFSSKTARDAALKAATKEETMICLVEPNCGKIHVFEGSKEPLSEKEKSDFTERRNISSKPVVRKLLYKNLQQSITANQVKDVAETFKDLMGTD